MVLWSAGSLLSYASPQGDEVRLFCIPLWCGWWQWQGHTSLENWVLLTGSGSNPNCTAIGVKDRDSSCTRLETDGPPSGARATRIHSAQFST